MSDSNIPPLHIAVVGATGAVGREMLLLLDELNIPIASLRAMASARSAGSSLPFRETTVRVEDLATADFSGVDIALFSAGGSTSKEFAPIAAAAGALVIDNSSAWRMDDLVPLTVPEVNPETVLDALSAKGGKGIIANPNCSTIQMVVALWPLHKIAPLTRVVVSTYQSVSGAGAHGINELIDSTRTHFNEDPEPTPKTFAHPIAFNALPHIDVFFDNGYTREELKMTFETRKIMGLPKLPLSATCVRIPVVRGHSEAVTVETASPLSTDTIRDTLAQAPGITILDNPTQNEYPTPRMCDGLDTTFVGRIRADLDLPNTYHFWVVSDNLRKGAATNAVQLIHTLAENNIATRAQRDAIASS